MEITDTINTKAMIHKKITSLFILFVLPMFMLTSCYEDYIEDYDTSIAYFSTQKPLRTVIADRDMEIKVGISIGGKRAVNTNDWGRFKIEPELLDDTSFELLPGNYYRLADPNTFRVSNKNLAIADVAISFTDEFFADEKAADAYYALPFRLTESSLDSINVGSFDPLGNELLPAKDYSIVVIKFISNYHGTYYVKGKVDELDGSGNVVNTVTYNNSDLSRNITRDVRTLSVNTLLRPGLANMVVGNKEGVQITVNPDGNSEKVYPVTVETPQGYTALTETSGTYYGNKDKPEIALKYKYKKGGKTYSVEETLVLRQDPLEDLRFEEW